MQKVFILTGLILIFIVSCGERPKQEISDNIKVSIRGDSKLFLENLKSILVEKIQEEGIVNAVSICSDTALKMTENFGKSKNIEIKRVSFKNRNPANVPDEFETRVLKHFEDLHSKNEIKPETEYFELVETNGIPKIRFMKPILIQAECLNCHGSDEQMIPDVKNIITQKYPQDKAKNYKLGDLRGAISIVKSMN